MKRILSVACVAGLLGFAAAARAEILSFSALLEAEVERITDGFPAQTSKQQVAVPDQVSELPAEALAALGMYATESDDLEGQGAAAARFNDPTLITNGSPEELEVEAVSYSSSHDTMYVSESSITETRRVSISAAEVDNAAGGLQTFNSQVFFRGTISVWCPNLNDDLTDLSALIELRVTQRFADETALTVLEAAVLVSGEQDGKITVDANGAIDPQSLVVLDESGNIDGTGSVYVVVAPNLLLPYTYDALIGEEFELELEIKAEVKGLTDSRGAAVVLGGPFSEFADLVDEVAGSSLGTQLQDLANTTSDAVTPDGYLPSFFGLLFPNCAAMGVETFGLTLISGVLCGVQMRRRRLFRRQR